MDRKACLEMSGAKYEALGKIAQKYKIFLAGIVNSYIHAASVDSGSKIIDYRGIVLTETGSAESMAAFTEINLAGLRSDRTRPGLNNLLSLQRFELYAESYSQ